MEFGGYRHGSESQDSDEPVHPAAAFEDKMMHSPSTSTSSPVLSTSSKGVENAKKRLRAFSIQKKAPVGPVTVIKPVCSGNTTVLIGKLCSAKVTPKPDKPVDDEKKIPKPPKPGGTKKYLNESYSELQKKTLSEIEDMKRKLELVELGIPLGLVCPSTNALPTKAMPTKAMPPIKTFLDNAKIDEIIREARKAKAEGKEFKFDYQKFVPDYDNPFQRKRDLMGDDLDRPDIFEKREEEYRKPRFDKDKRFYDDKDRRKSDKFERRRAFKRDDRSQFRDKNRPRERDKKEEHRFKGKDDRSRDRDLKSKDKDDKYKKDVEDQKDRAKVEQKEETRKNTEILPEKQKDKDGKETDVNLNDYLVCDSWSLDTEGKNSPRVEDKSKKGVEDKSKKLIGDITTPIDPLDQLRQSLGKKNILSPKPKQLLTLGKLKPVVDCFEFEIDPNEAELLGVFDGKGTNPKKGNVYDSPIPTKYDMRKDLSSDGMNEDIFLESVINEIKQENMSDDDHHDKGLVEYDESPVRDSNEHSVGSVTPDLEDSIRSQSQRSDYSDGYKSVDSRKSSESGYKSNESGHKSEATATEAKFKSDSKFTDSIFKPIDPMKSNEYELRPDRFKSTFRPAESEPTPPERRSRSTETHSKLGDSTSPNHSKDRDSPTHSRDRSKSSEGSLKLEPIQKANSKLCKDDRQLLSVERELDEALEDKMSKDTVDSLETWSFVLKICQPLLFRHDKNKCYKETRTVPKLWFTQNPKLCDCVMDRTIVYEELERCKMDLVGRLYGCDQIPDAPLVIARTWYPQLEQCVVAHAAPLPLSSEWDVDDPPRARPGPNDDESLDREYQRFMEAVSWPDTQSGQEGRSLTPVRINQGEDEQDEPRAKRARVTSEGWSQDSEPDDDDRTKAPSMGKGRQRERRKRKRSPEPSTASDSERAERRKNKGKKKDDKKKKSKAKRRRLEKKMLKKLKDKKRKKKDRVQEESDIEEEEEIEPKKKDKKAKKKKQQKTKKKAEKKKRRVKSSSTSSSDSSSDSSDEFDQHSEKKAKRKKEAQVKKKKKKEKKKRRKQSSTDSQSEELFDVNILNNIKAERLTDDERHPAPPARLPTPPARPHREIINVKQLHDHFSSNVQIKQEVEDEPTAIQPPNESPKTIENQEDAKIIEEENSKEKEDSNEGDEAPKIVEEGPKIVEEIPKTEVPRTVEEIPKKVEVLKKVEEVATKVESVGKKVEVAKNVEVIKRVDLEAELMDRFDLDEQYSAVSDKPEKVEFKEPYIPTPPLRDESSQCSSQESVQSISSVKEAAYEKDESHLGPSCDNSNYSFNDVINSQAGYKNMEEKFEGYENYEMYEQMAMAYQSDVASQQISPPSCMGEQRIETVVRAHARGEIKCDWRASDGPAPATQRPSRWGLKPGEVNIVLTGGGDHPDPRDQPATTQAVYKIQSLANRDTSMGYDEAYQDMYGAADRLQYGDCFAPPAPPPPPAPARTPSRASGRARVPSDPRLGSLDDRISRALNSSVLGEVTRDDNGDKDTPEKGILITRSSGARGGKRVSFADGYQPGQDSDTEQPPAKKRKKAVFGCAWPCPAGHPAHVPLWDALPPPPPPPGSPPPAPPPAPPLHLLRRPPAPHPLLAMTPQHLQQKRDPAASMPNFMPPEPPPGLISFP